MKSCLALLLIFVVIATANDYIVVAPQVWEPDFLHAHRLLICIQIWRVNVPEHVSLTAIGVLTTETVDVHLVTTSGRILQSTVSQIVFNANNGTFQRSKKSR